MFEWWSRVRTRMEAWRDTRSFWGRGCGCVGLLGLALFCVAATFGGIMGDYGGGAPQEVAEHTRATHAWFRNCLGGLAFAILLGRWWAKGIDIGRKSP